MTRLLPLLVALTVRDLKLAAGRPGQWLLPMLFFLLVALLHPFALGPDAGLLRRIAPGLVWTALLLAALIPVATLYAEDAADGTLDQISVRGIAFETLAAARTLALWLCLGGPVLAALPVAALLLGMDSALLLRVAAGVALGSGGLAALASAGAALTLGARGGAGLVALLVLPLALPLLIFGSRPDVPGALGLLAAAALAAAALCPFAAGAALRAARG